MYKCLVHQYVQKKQKYKHCKHIDNNILLYVNYSVTLNKVFAQKFTIKPLAVSIIFRIFVT